MSKLLAFRAPDHLAQSILELATQLSKSQTDVIIDALTIGLGLPATPLSPIEERLAVLETQMSTVIDRLDVIAVESVVIGSPIPTDRHLKTDLPQQALLDIGLEPMELGAIDSKISPESIRDSSEADSSTPLDLVAIDSDICQAIIAVLKPHPESGYYFRSEYLGQTKISHNYRQQAIQMGFSSESTRIDGKQIRVWWNRDYCITYV